jgi:hypothetical protein
MALSVLVLAGGGEDVVVADRGESTRCGIAVLSFSPPAL